MLTRSGEPACPPAAHEAMRRPRRAGECADLGTDDSTSRSLLLRVRDNDQDAWRRLVNLYAPLVGHWFRNWGAAPDDVPDLLQEVFGAVARHLSTYRPDQPGSTFRGWLRTIARNKFLDHRRGRGTLAEGGSEAMVRLEGVAGADEPPDALGQRLGGRRAVSPRPGAGPRALRGADLGGLLAGGDGAAPDGRGRRRAGPDSQHRPPGPVAGPPPPQAGAGRADRLTPPSRAGTPPGSIRSPLVSVPTPIVVAHRSSADLNADDHPQVAAPKGSRRIRADRRGNRVAPRRSRSWWLRSSREPVGTVPGRPRTT